MNKQEQKMLEIYESYLNGNISWVKKEVANMNLEGRKQMFQYVNETVYKDVAYNKDINFFFDLI